MPTVRSVAAARDLQVGTVIQDADVKPKVIVLTLEHDRDDLAYPRNALTENRKRVIGHTVQGSIHQGQAINLYKISR